MSDLRKLDRLTVESAWQSLFTSMSYWATRSQAQQAEGLPKYLTTLVEDARFFAHRYKEFFEGVPKAYYERQNTDQWTVLHRARSRLANEWDTVRRVLEQRELKRYRERLNTLDQLAQECLRPVLSETAEKATTYYQKVFDITRFAFSVIPLIGVPYSAIHLPQSLLAVPHEAGHYVFWNGTASFDHFEQFQAALESAIGQDFFPATSTPKKQQRAFFRHTAQAYITWIRWLNELFADVYGTLVAGPASGWAIQSIIKGEVDISGLDHDDGEHPVPYLRPFIHITTLRLMAELAEDEFKAQLMEAADELQHNWIAIWPSNIETLLVSPDRLDKINDMIEQDLPLIIRAILDVPMKFKNGGESSLGDAIRSHKFYNQPQHDRIIAAVEQLKNGQSVELTSMLEVSAAAQLAIIGGVEIDFIRQTFGFTDEEAHYEDIVSDDDPRLARFTDYLAGVTNTKGVRAQQQAWRSMIESSLSETDEHGSPFSRWWDHHHHPHPH